MRAIKEFWDMSVFSRTKHAQWIYEIVLTDKFAISHNGRIKLDPQCLCMIRRASTHFTVSWVDRRILAPGVSNRGLQDPLVLRGRVVLQKDVLHAPETTRCKGGDLRLL